MKRLKLIDLYANNGIVNNIARKRLVSKVESFLEFVCSSEAEDYLYIGMYKIINLGDGLFAIETDNDKVMSEVGDLLYERKD